MDIIMDINHKKAAGVKSIAKKILKLAKELIATWLFDIFNFSLVTGIFSEGQKTV